MKPFPHRSRRFAGLLIVILFLVACTQSPLSEEPATTTFDIEYRLVLTEPGFTRAWIPIPETNTNQTIGRLEIHTGLTMYLGRDKFYGNKFVIIEDRVHGRDTVTISFRCTRRQAVPQFEELENTMRQFYLAPSYSEPYDEQWDQICDSLDAEQEAFEYRLFNFLLSSLSPTDTESGHLALAYGQGRATALEYVGLFNAISRTKGIPARFKGGLVIPDRPGGRIRSIAAWSEFYFNRKGWVPVDLYGAERDIRNANKYFGTLDSRRILFSTGRDIFLPNGSPNDVADHIVLPYVKINGRLSTKHEVRISYREIQP